MIGDNTTPYTIEVEVEAWQNERYRSIFGGWGAPIQSDSHFFSDVSGTIEAPFIINSLNQNVPYSHLPAGWQWANDWQVETTCSYGYVDTIDGWGYSTTFKRLFTNTLKGVLDGEKKSMSLVRRRRWTRKRVCITPEAKAHFIARYEWMQAKREAMIKYVNMFTRDSQIVSAFEERRKPGVKDSEDYIITNLKETASMLDNIWTKLQMLKTFLVERGTIEMEYAQRLHKLSRKWINAGGHTIAPVMTVIDQDGRPEEPTEPTTRNSVSGPTADSVITTPKKILAETSTGADDPLTPVPTSGINNYAAQPTTPYSILHSDTKQVLDDPAAHGRLPLSAQEALPKGFFYTINVAGGAVADQLLTFATILKTSLPLDIEMLMVEIKSVFQDVCLEEGARIRERWVRSHERLHNRYQAYLNAVTVTTDSLAFKSSRLHHHLFHDTASTSAPSYQTNDVVSAVAATSAPSSSSSFVSSSSSLGAAGMVTPTKGLSAAAAAAVSIGGIAVTYDTNSDKLITQHSVLDTSMISDDVTIGSSRDRSDSNTSIDSSNDRNSLSLSVSPPNYLTPIKNKYGGNANNSTDSNDQSSPADNNKLDAFSNNLLSPLSPFAAASASALAAIPGAATGNNKASFAYNLALHYHQAWSSTAAVDAHDIWLLLQLYRLSVLECQGITSMYVAFVNRQRKVAEHLIARASVLLKAAVNHFSSQLSMAWLEPITFLNEIASYQNEDEEEGVDVDSAGNGETVGERELNDSDNPREQSKATVAALSHSIRGVVEDGSGMRHHGSNDQSQYDEAGAAEYPPQRRRHSGGSLGEVDDNESAANLNLHHAMGLDMVAGFDSLNVAGYISMVGRVRYCRPQVQSQSGSSSSSVSSAVGIDGAYDDKSAFVSAMLSPSNLKRQQQAPQHVYDWKDGIALLTCNSMLHILEPPLDDDDENYDYNEDDTADGSGDVRRLMAAHLSPGGAKTKVNPRVNVQWLSQEPVCSINVSEAFLEPVLMNLGMATGLGDAFIIHSRNHTGGDGSGDRSIMGSLSNMNISQAAAGLDKNMFSGAFMSAGGSVSGVGSLRSMGSSGNVSSTSGSTADYSKTSAGHRSPSPVVGASRHSQSSPVPPGTGSASSARRSGSTASLADLDNDINPSRHRERVPTLAILVGTSAEAGGWMHAITNPFISPGRDPPTGDADEEEFKKEINLYYKASLDQ